jgi:hypothetical protein
VYAHWATSPKYLVPGAPGRVDISLTTVGARGGWSPEDMPIRAWLGGEIGTLTGTGVALVNPQEGSSTWVAAGAGFGVAWPMSPHTRLVGTFEIDVPLVRPRFGLAEGSEIFRSSAATARCALGLEVGWP